MYGSTFTHVLCRTWIDIDIFICITTRPKYSLQPTYFIILKSRNTFHTLKHNTFSLRYWFSYSTFFFFESFFSSSFTSSLHSIPFSECRRRYTTKKNMLWRPHTTDRYDSLEPPHHNTNCYLYLFTEPYYRTHSALLYENFYTLCMWFDHKYRKFHDWITLFRTIT